MVEIPKDSRYYLIKSKEAAVNGDCGSALELVRLAARFAKDGDEVLSCALEKIDILEMLRVEGYNTYYDAIARAGDNPEIYLRLFNSSIFTNNIELSNYYLNKMNTMCKGDNFEFVCADISNEAMPVDDEAIKAIHREVSIRSARDKIRLINKGEEKVKSIMKEALGECIQSHKYREGVDKLLGAVGICPEFDDELGSMAVNCAAMSNDGKLAAQTFIKVSEMLPDNVLSLCNSYSFCMMTGNRKLQHMLIGKLQAALERCEIKDAKTARLVAYTLNEAGYFQQAFDMLEKFDGEAFNAVGKRLKSVILFNLDREEEALDNLRMLELIESKEDRLLRRYYARVGKTYILIGNNIYNVMNMHYEKVFMSCPLSEKSIKEGMSEGMLKDAYLHALLCSQDKLYANGEYDAKMFGRYDKMTEIFVKSYPQEVLPLLYDVDIHLCLRRTILFYFIYSLSELQRQTQIQLFSPDRKITVECEGYLLRSDIMMDRQVDTYSDKIRCACANAIADICFARELKIDEIDNAVKKINDIIESGRVKLCSLRTAYIGILASVEPCVSEIESITNGAVSASIIKNACKRLGIEIKE